MWLLTRISCSSCTTRPSSPQWDSGAWVRGEVNVICAARSYLCFPCSRRNRQKHGLTAGQFRKSINYYILDCRSISLIQAELFSGSLIQDTSKIIQIFVHLCFLSELWNFSMYCLSSTCVETNSATNHKELDLCDGRELTSPLRLMGLLPSFFNNKEVMNTEDCQLITFNLFYISKAQNQLKQVTRVQCSAILMKIGYGKPFHLVLLTSSTDR